MEYKFNRLLTRQLKKYLKENKVIDNSLLELLNAVNNSYKHYEQDRILIERSLELSSTELLESNTQLLKNEQLIRSINKNINEAIYRVTREGDLIYANDAFAELFGYKSINEVMKVKFYNFYYEKNKRKELLEKVFKTGSLKKEEVLYKKKDGSFFWGLVSDLRTIDLEGREVFDGAIIDISEIKENERKLLETNTELQKTNKELDRFVYSASHDLRAPLRSLLGLLSLADLEIHDVDKVKNYLNHMQKSIVKLDTYITDIIDYSRNSRIEVRPELIDFKKIIYDAFEKFEYLEGFSKIIKGVNVNDYLFYSDRTRITVLFNNIISNSIKYYNPYNLKPYLDIDVIITKSEALLNISDNGIGMNKDQLNRIFDMFYRASEDSYGSGIGLYIVKEVVDTLKGKINVESTIGEGSSFMITLPNLYS